ncbi:MAG: hypothetical protein JO255_12340 [Alphaproteobacteria bacterium]|nr:hypothetical protein [Alphaproteobacteria bacterium]
MKSTDTFELSAAWWKAERPKTLPDPGLGEALQKLEALEKHPKKDADLTVLKARLANIRLIATLVAKVEKACLPKIHGPTKTVLGSDKTKKLLAAKEKEIADADKAYHAVLENYHQKWSGLRKYFEKIEPEVSKRLDTHTHEIEKFTQLCNAETRKFAAMGKDAGKSEEFKKVFDVVKRERERLQKVVRDVNGGWYDLNEEYDQVVKSDKVLTRDLSDGDTDQIRRERETAVDIREALKKKWEGSFRDAWDAAKIAFERLEKL